MSPWKHRMKKTCNGAAQHGPAKAQCVATMLKVSLAYGSGVIREQPANGSKCNVYGPPRFGLLGEGSSRTISRSLRAGLAMVYRKMLPLSQNTRINPLIVSPAPTTTSKPKSQTH